MSRRARLGMPPGMQVPLAARMQCAAPFEHQPVPVQTGHLPRRAIVAMRRMAVRWRIHRIACGIDVDALHAKGGTHLHHPHAICTRFQIADGGRKRVQQRCKDRSVQQEAVEA